MECSLEKITNLGHSRAVGIGMVAALFFSRDKGFIMEEICRKIVDRLEKFDLPVNFDMDLRTIMKNIR